MRLYRQRSSTEPERAKYELAQLGAECRPGKGLDRVTGIEGPSPGGALQDPQAALETGAAWVGGCCGRSPADRSMGRGVSPAGYDRE